MVDVHSHLLPFVDDGAKDINGMNSMLSIYRDEGVDLVVATPHFKSGVFLNGYDEVVSCIEANGLSGRVVPGQEVFLDGYTLGYCRDGLIRGINGGSYLLVELAFDGFDVNYLSYVIELQGLGFRVVIAHPERYSYFLDSPCLLNDFIEVGCFFQVNSASLEGLLGADVKRFVLLMAEHGLVDFVGSDAHDGVRRAPRLRGAVGVLDRVRHGLGGVVLGNARALVDDGVLEVQVRRLFDEKRSGLKESFFRLFGR